MKKKCIAMMLSMAMTVAALAGCGNSADPATGSSEAKESTTVSEAATETATTEAATEAASEATEAEEIPVDHFAGTELTIAIWKGNGTLYSDPGNTSLAKEIEEATGIKVNWITVDDSTATEKTATMLAGDVPDIMIGFIGRTTREANMDLWYDLSEEGLLETYAPDIVEKYNQSGAAWDAVTEADGSIKVLLSNTELNWNAQGRGIQYINKTWLDQLGLEVPTNTEELYEALCAFRDNDMDGDGDPTNEYPVSFCENDYSGRIKYFANLFGIAGENDGVTAMGKMIKNGEFVSVFDSQEYRDYLEFVHSLFEADLVDVEGWSQTSEQYNAKINNGQVGLYATWAPPSEFRDDYVPLALYCQAYEDVEPVLNGKYQGFAASSYFLVSKDTENVEACLWWWNYLGRNAESCLTGSYGARGYMWDYDEDGKAKSLGKAANEIEVPADWEGTDQEFVDYCSALLPGGRTGFITKEDDALYTYRDMTYGTRSYWIGELEKQLNHEYPSSRKVAAEKNEELAELDVELENYMSTFMAESIMNGVTDASWEKHLEDLEAVGYGDWIDWWEGFVNEEF